MLSLMSALVAGVVSMSNECAWRWCFSGCVSVGLSVGLSVRKNTHRNTFSVHKNTFSVLSVAQNCADTKTEGTYEKVFGCGAHSFDVLSK
jgi:hypothetical protein